MVKKEEKVKIEEVKQVENDNEEKTEVKKQSTEERVKEFIRKNAVLILIVFAVFFLFCIFLIQQNNKLRQNGGDDGTPYIPITKHEVKVHIDFVANLIFSTYDVKLSVGGEDKLLDHGKDADFVFNLEEGKNTLTFKNDEDSSVKTTVELDVTSDMEVGYKISCYSGKIDVVEQYIDRDESLGENMIKVDMDKKYFNSMKYEEAKSKLEELGFTNVTLNPLYDIVLGITPEGSIENVTIDGRDDYRRGDVFDKSVAVVISYHMKEMDDPARVKPPYDSDSAKGKTFEDVKKDFEGAGFTNIVLTEYKSASGTADEVVLVYIDGSAYYIDKGLTYEPDVEVEIFYRVIDANMKPKPDRNDTVLDLYYAKKAFENYGKSIYKFGFKCHWIMDLYAEDEREDGTYYFKVGVTITNGFNAKYDAIAEGVVSGTNSNPKVSKFRVLD